MLRLFISFYLATFGFSQILTTEYPTLPTLWEAETIESGAPGSGKGIESYSFVDEPTEDNPSALWSNYVDCQRLIYVPNNYNAKRYLLGCDAVDCCYEEQDGNQVEFQIPNVHYTNPSKKVEVYYQRVNITNFGETIEADEWSWSWNVKDKLLLSQDFRAYTLPCNDCVNGVQLIQWQSRAMGLEWYPTQFKSYRGYDQDSTEGKQFISKFQVPEICQKNNLLKCSPGVHDKYFSQLSQLDKGGQHGQQTECDVATYLKNAGFPRDSIGTMVCISKYESSWNCDAINKNNDGIIKDYGLFEINSDYCYQCGPFLLGYGCFTLMDCQRNTNCAYEVYKSEGYNWWDGYQSHKEECDNYPAPVC